MQCARYIEVPTAWSVIMRETHVIQVTTQIVPCEILYYLFYSASVNLDLYKQLLILSANIKKSQVISIDLNNIYSHDMTYTQDI